MDHDIEADPTASFAGISQYFNALADERQRNPSDDIVTTLVTADVDGSKLSSAELVFFVLMLAVAGNETTRNAITHGMNAFIDNPDQWEHYRRDRPDTAVDEIIRWATPISAFQRTAHRDTTVGDHPINRANAYVSSTLSDANFDDTVFDEPHIFIHRPHPRIRIWPPLIPGITKAASPQPLRSGWLNGVKKLPVTYV